MTQKHGKVMKVWLIPARRPHGCRIFFHIIYIAKRTHPGQGLGVGVQNLLNESLKTVDKPAKRRGRDGQQLDIFFMTLHAVLCFQTTLRLASVGDRNNENPIDEPRGAALQFQKPQL